MTAAVSAGRADGQAGERNGGRNHIGDVVLALLGVVMDRVLQDEAVDRGDEEPRELVQADHGLGGCRVRLRRRVPR